MKKVTYDKQPFPVSNVRRFLEPGPIVLVSSAWKDKHNIMTMGWHSVMEFTPSLIGCVIAGSNHTFDLVRKSKACVINIPTIDMIDQVVGIGTTSGRDTDKFKHFHLTAERSKIVHPPSIKECYASFECQLADDALIDKYNFFVWEVVAARVAVSPEYPETVHYRGEGTFMLSGKHIHRPELRGM